MSDEKRPPVNLPLIRHQILTIQAYLREKVWPKPKEQQSMFEEPRQKWSDKG